MYSFISFIESDNTISTNDEQLSKADCPILITELGIIISFNEMQISNDDFPIEITDEGITIFSNDKHFLKV